MKTKLSIIGGMLLSCFLNQAQLINPLSLNTAITANLNGVLVTPGTPDGGWKASITGINGQYVSAVKVNPVSGWAPQQAKAGWISYPHTCTPNIPSEHSCILPNGDVDEFYKRTIDLPDSICGTPASQFCLNMDFFADNLVREIYVNGVVAWTNLAYTGALDSDGSLYNIYTDFNSGNQKKVALCSNWKAGSNVLIVRVGSGAPPVNGMGYTGFMASVNINQTTKDTCHPVMPNSGCCLGNLCSDTENVLNGDYEIPLNTYNFNFNGDTRGGDKVNVGYSCGTAGKGKLNAVTSFATNNSPVGSTPESISIFGNNLYSLMGTGVGVMGVANNNEEFKATSVGVWGDAVGNADNIGGKFFAGGKRLNANYYNIGVSTVAQASNGNPPAYTYKLAYPTGANIGIYATGRLNNSLGGEPLSNVGRDWAGWFDGDVNINGNGWILTTWTTSDKRFKKEITKLENMSERLKKLNGYSYSFKTDEFKYKNFDSKRHIGFIAQEVKEVFPELVNEDSKGYLAVDYQGMIPVLLQLAKEQQQQIDELKAIVYSSQGNNAKPTAIPVNLSDKNVLVLNQNVPNPFAESTVISYNIPSDFTKAQIIFSTSDGKVIKVMEVTEKGSGSLNVFANDLTHGVYSYTLVVDGKTVDTKKMIKE
ncbi:MAG: tail fiber domain-containing protein [Bacteroidia bacterium]|nr:tail fiber domain-containing protein [Bacteroidia bacterium]